VFAPMFYLRQSLSLGIVSLDQSVTFTAILIFCCAALSCSTYMKSQGLLHLKTALAIYGHPHTSTPRQWEHVPSRPFPPSSLPYSSTRDTIFPPSLAGQAISGISDLVCSGDHVSRFYAERLPRVLSSVVARLILLDRAVSRRVNS
jgi:hypothetical protein